MPAASVCVHSRTYILIVKVLSAALLHCTVVCTDDYDVVFSRVLDVLPLSAAVNESHARIMNELKRHGGHGLGFPDLHDEVFQ